MAERRGSSGTSVLDLPTEGDVDTGTIGANGAQETEAQSASDNVTPISAGKRGGKREPRDFANIGPDEMVSLNVRVPNGLRGKLEETATGQNLSIPQLITKMVSEAYEYTLPQTATKKRQKYASEEERKKAQKDAQAHNRMVTKALLDAVNEGKLGIDVEALVAEYLAKQQAEQQAASEGATS